MKYKTYDWLIRVIKSCTTVQQVGTPVSKLIYQFNYIYNDEFLYRGLMDISDNRLDIILKNLTN